MGFAAEARLHLQVPLVTEPPVAGWPGLTFLSWGSQCLGPNELAVSLRLSLISGSVPSAGIAGIQHHTRLLPLLLRMDRSMEQGPVQETLSVSTSVL